MKTYKLSGLETLKEHDHDFWSIFIFPSLMLTMLQSDTSNSQPIFDCQLSNYN